MDGYNNMYSLVEGLFALITTGPVWFIAGPILTLFIAVRVLRWAFTTSRGEKDIEAMSDELQQNWGNLRSSGDRWNEMQQRRADRRAARMRRP